MKKKIINNPRTTFLYIIAGLTGLLSMIFLACPCIRQTFDGFYITNSAYATINFKYNTMITLSSICLILLIVLSAILFIIGIAGVLYSEDLTKKDGFYKIIQGDTVVFIVAASLILTIASTIFIHFGILGGNLTIITSPYLGITLAGCSLIGVITLWLLELKANPRPKNNLKANEQKALNTTQELNKKLQDRMGTKIN